MPTGADSQRQAPQDDHPILSDKIIIPHEEDIFLPPLNHCHCFTAFTGRLHRTHHRWISLMTSPQQL